jgi:glycosyltransferase involved in cell wall biosynthesis
LEPEYTQAAQADTQPPRYRRYGTCGGPPGRPAASLQVGQEAAMRILHLIATGQRRGAEVFASDLIAALHAPGLDQRVAVLHGGPPWAVRFGVPATALGARRRPLDPGAVAGLRRVLRDWRPDLVQAHGGEPLKYAALAAPGAPIVYRRIGSVSWLSSGPRRLLYGRLVRRAARVVAVAEAVREETVAAFGLDPGRVVTIPNGVDPGRLAPTRGRAATRTALGIDQLATVVLSLGALTWEKDPLGQLAASAPALRRRPDLVHLFAGEGPLRADLEAAAGRERVDRRVLLLGSRGDVGDLLAASDLLLFASRTEGMPASLIEAGVAGLPVAGVALPGVPEVVEAGVTGLLVAPGDRDGLAAAVERLAADGGLRAAMGAAARSRCRERHGIDAIAGAYRDLYREVVAACAVS